MSLSAGDAASSTEQVFPIRINHRRGDAKLSTEILERLQTEQRSMRRQRWLSSALVAGLVGLVLLAAGRPRSPVDESIRTEAVPIGAIIPFWGGPDDLVALETYELCDGGEVLTEDSPIRGYVKPDLRNRFLAGANLASLNLWTDPVSGGVDTIPARPLGQTEGHALTIAQLPKHDHGAQVSTVHGSELGGAGRLVTKYELGSGQGTPNGMDSRPGPGEGEFDVRWGTAVPIEDHTHPVTVTKTGGGQSHSHRLPDVPAHDNRPSFVGVHFLIRVK